MSRKNGGRQRDDSRRSGYQPQRPARDGDRQQPQRQAQRQPQYERSPDQHNHLPSPAPRLAQPRVFNADGVVQPSRNQRQPPLQQTPPNQAPQRSEWDELLANPQALMQLVRQPGGGPQRAHAPSSNTYLPNGQLLPSVLPTNVMEWSANDLQSYDPAADDQDQQTEPGSLGAYQAYYAVLNTLIHIDMLSTEIVQQGEQSREALIQMIGITLKTLFQQYIKVLSPVLQQLGEEISDGS